jgi:hypothetical protein
LRPLTLNTSLPVLAIGLGISLASCWGFTKERGEWNDKPREAYVPVYVQDPEASAIKSLPAQPIVESGKIYVRGNLLFQVEQLKGVHVIDYSDKANPVKLGFIKSRGCSELAVKGNYLIINNQADLVTIDISQTGQVREVARIRNAFPHFHIEQYHNSRPPEKGVYYVCPEYMSGEVSHWKLEKEVRGAYCYNP